MIDQLRGMAIFQTVAELGSFRQAAARLKLSPSVVSHHVSSLETQLGTALLYRSTRRMSLTPAGEDLLQAARRMTSAAQEGLTAVGRQTGEHAGKLRVTINTASGCMPFARIYTGFARAYPKVELDMHISDHHVPLEGGAFDVAIRGTTSGLPDSGYKARRVAAVPIGIFAARSYAEARPVPRDIDDLASWDRIQAPPIPWAAIATPEAGPPPAASPRIAMTCDNFAMARNFVREGLGLMVEAVGPFAEDVKSGRIIRVLPQVKLRPINIFVVYPANAPADSLARVFVDYLTAQDWLVAEGYLTR